MIVPMKAHCPDWLHNTVHKSCISAAGTTNGGSRLAYSARGTSASVQFGVVVGRISIQRNSFAFSFRLAFSSSPLVPSLGIFFHRVISAEFSPFRSKWLLTGTADVSTLRTLTIRCRFRNISKLLTCISSATWKRLSSQESSHSIHGYKRQKKSKKCSCHRRQADFQHLHKFPLISLASAPAPKLNLSRSSLQMLSFRHERLPSSSSGIVKVAVALPRYN